MNSPMLLTLMEYVMGLAGILMIGFILYEAVCGLMIANRRRRLF